MSVTQTNSNSMMLLAWSLYQTHKSAQFIDTDDLINHTVYLVSYTYNTRAYSDFSFTCGHIRLCTA